MLGLLLRHERPGGRPYRRERAIGHLPFRNCRRLDVSPCGPLQRASEERGIPAARGGKWSAVQVSRLLEAAGSPFEASAVAIA